MSQLRAVRPALFALSLLAASASASAQTPAAPAAPAVAPAAPAAMAARPAYEADPKYIAALADGKRLAQRRQYSFALDAYRKASKIAAGQSPFCLLNMYKMQMALGSYKDAIATATQFEALAPTAAIKSIAEADKGQAMLAQAGEKARPEQLEAAHETFSAALNTFPGNLSAKYQDGCVLARMGKTDDASKEFAACADAASPTDPMRIRARHFAENPELSTHKMAPPFEVTALDGTKFMLDQMGGRVVLIDFWATWCGPCNEELPNIKKIAREFANEPFTVISISWDADEKKWQDFIQKNGMTWLQYRDADHKLSNLFGINSIPHYFTIDSDGVLTAEMLGSGHDVEGKIKKLLKRAHESAPPASQIAAASSTAPSDR